MEDKNQCKWQALEIEEGEATMLRRPFLDKIDNMSAENKEKCFGVPRKVWFGSMIAFLIAISSCSIPTTAAPSSNPIASSSSNPTVPSDIEVLANVVLPSVKSIDDDLNRTAPQYRALEWLVYNDTRGLTIEDDTIELLERFSLVTLFYSARQHSSVIDDDKNTWLKSSCHCDWDPSFNCDENGRVTVFAPSRDFNDGGTLPPEIGNLQSLREIGLVWCGMKGSIPSEIGNLQQLIKLELYDNKLSGTIPSEIGNLQQLTDLELGNNNFSGTIPSEIGNLQQLSSLRLVNNHFSGSIPSEMGNMQRLINLSLGRNNFSGTIPSEIGKMHELNDLSLDRNNLSGTIPSEIGNMQGLHWLRLFKNNFSGTIPSEIGNLHELKSLDVTDNKLSGTIP
eukprot:scaffold322_cov88-Cylindrotheca_fusiformis.AAC.5